MTALSKNQTFLRFKILVNEPITYVKAQTLKIDLHDEWYSTGIFFSNIGIALLKLASNSTSKVIRWEIIVINIDAKIINTQTLIKGSAPVAKMAGIPA